MEQHPPCIIREIPKVRFMERCLFDLKGLERGAECKIQMERGAMGVSGALER